MKIHRVGKEKRFALRLRLIRLVFGIARFAGRRPVTPFINLLCRFDDASRGGFELITPYQGCLLIRLDVHSLVERKILCSGYFERWITDFLTRSLKPGHVVIDVGANIGCQTLVMANAVGPSGRVLAFEPNPRMFKRLQANVLLNHFNQVNMFRTALSNSRGHVSMFIPREGDSNQGLGSLHRANLDAGCEEVSVALETLDEVVRERNLSRVDLIKLDVEGHESQVLLGARQTLEKFKPILIFEFSERQWRNAGFSPERVEQMLADLGYDLFVLRRELTTSIRHGVAEECDLVALPVG